DLFALVLDLIPPVLVAETIDPFATTGDPFGMDLDVTDNFGVKRVEVEHWQGTSPGHAWVNMTLVSGTEEAGTWNVTLLARSDTLEDLNLRVHAWDLADNKMDVISYVRSVRDNDPPAFVEDHSPDSAETDMSYTFNVSVEDNIGLQDVWIEYWYGDGNRTGATMELRGSTWEAVIIVGDTLDDLHYYLWCRDTSDNRNSTSVRTVPVIDINGPQIVNEGTGRTATTGDPFEFTLTAWDNVGLKGATLWYAYGDDELVPVDMMVEEAGPSGNVLYSLIIDVRSDFVGNITYRIGLEDLYGNNFTTFDKYVRVVDDDPPMVLDEDISPSATTGDPFSYRLTVTDNIGIASVQLDYFFSDDPPNATISTEAMV
ncbi:MAG: hypothetical protein GWN18_15220, partial [Thermoplasmata archaeon]|nr:hypothetical protein [Thermoplasmata archaeon]NIS13410.1 hypothetical protein [Thermoplasmata archaeon]NIS21297.1 hypothetical protein [Thermoplasmata archaeon]NIT78813.1 hypothetical protein [Thermoplasmata archaeon]NIU50350.1 hypothetical protein [Thermoplasmata archaeon]